MVGELVIERAPNLASASDHGKFWYAALCPAHGWVTAWSTASMKIRTLADEHKRGQSCAPDFVRTPGDIWARIPKLDPPKLKAAKAWQVSYWAKCGMCGWGTKRAKTPTRPETFAFRHREKTGHGVVVLRDDARIENCLTGIVESRFRGTEQLVMF